MLCKCKQYTIYDFDISVNYKQLMISMQGIIFSFYPCILKIADLSIMLCKFEPFHSKFFFNEENYLAALPGIN